MSYLHSITAMVIVLGLLGLFYYFAQRLMNPSASGISKRRIKVVERVSLGDKRVLLLVQVGQQQLLLGATNNNISMLSPLGQDEPIEELPEGEKSEEAGLPRFSFRQLLESLR